MAGIWEGIKQVYGALAIVPIVPFALIYGGFLLYSRDRKRSLRVAMDVTTALLIGVVSVLFNQIFNSTFGFYGILLLVLIAGGLLGNLQYRTKGRVNPKRIGRAIWRLGFFLMSLLYVLFMCIRIGQSFWSV